MERLRASLEVRAGVIPGHAEAELTKQFHYLEKEFEEDLKLPQDQSTRFVAVRDEAWTYARNLIEPSKLNWVELTWIWY